MIFNSISRIFYNTIDKIVTQKLPLTTNQIYSEKKRAFSYPAPGILAKYIVVALIPVFLFQLSSRSQISKMDIHFERYLTEIRLPCRTKALKLISNSTNNISLAIPISLLVAGAIRHDKDMQKKAVVIAESIIISTGVTHALKYTFKRTRPYIQDTLIIKVGPGGSYSFPSGHASEAFSTATSLAMAYPKWYIVTPAYLWAGTVAFSRMYLGVHYPSDVLAGALVGSGSAILAYKINKWLTAKNEARKPIVFIY